MSKKCVVTKVATADQLFESEPTRVYWLTVIPQTAGTDGLITIRDGTDANGTPQWQAWVRETKHFHFAPPIRCVMGLFIDVDANIDSYTIGYLTEDVALSGP